MPTRHEPWPAGTPCWVDYGATDLDAARAFYADVIGWSYTGGDPAFGGYLTCETNGLPAAGMALAIDPNAPPSWTTYLASDDTDATVTRVTDAGGTILAPAMDVGPLGRMAIAADPAGHAFGIWQAGQHIGVRVYNEPGALVWNELSADEPDAVQPFYTTVFGLAFAASENLPGYTTIMLDGRPVGGMIARQPGMAAGWGACFTVRSADEAVTLVERNGGTTTMPAQDAPFGRFASFTDPWGAVFAVLAEIGA
jgi:predicted enzyme related to lactoylglutathione lyase